MQKKYFYSVLLIILFITTYSEAQVQTLGGCGQSYTNLVVGDIPTYNTGASGAWYGLGWDSNLAPFNVLSAGVWCGTRSRRVGSGPTVSITCSSAYPRGPGIGNWSINTCGINYNSNGLNSPSPQINSPTVVTGSDQYWISYNLCEPPNSTTTGAFFSEFNINGGTISGIRLIGYPQPLSIGTQTSILSGRTNPGVPFVRCSSYDYFVQDGNSIFYNHFDVPTHTFTFNQATFAGYVVLSWLDNLNMGFFRNATHVMSGTINSTALTFYDAMRFPTGTCTPSTYSQMNPLTGYLYTVCFEFYNAGNNQTTRSAIFQVDLTNYHFIRSKAAPYVWNYRNTFIGINHQMMSAFSNNPNGSPGALNFTTPLLYCIADPYNPVFLNSPLIVAGLNYNVPTSTASGAYRIAANPADSGCFPSTFFTVQQQSLSDFGVFLDFCGSGVFNDATDCNTATTGSTCCAQNCTPVNVGGTCFNATLCANATVCSATGTCPTAYLSNTTSCGSATSCGAAPMCDGLGDCNSSVPFVNNTVCANATSCMLQTVCNGSSLLCPTQNPKANTTVCGIGTTDCVATSFCNGFNDTCNQNPFYNSSVQCGLTSTDCVGISFCPGTNQTCNQQPFYNSSVQCGFTATDCVGISFCPGTNQTCTQTPFYNSSVSCGLNSTDCLAQSFCPGTSQTCTQQSFYNSSVQCGLTPTDCLGTSFCPGTNQTCVQQPFYNSSVSCGLSPTDCLAQSFCPGTNQTCVQQPFYNSSVHCGLSPDSCTPFSFCPGTNQTCNQQFYNSSVICLNETDCVNPGFCNGFNDTCIAPTNKPNGTFCGTNYTCFSPDFCVSGTCQFNPIPDPPTPITFQANTVNETAIDLTWQSGGGSTSTYQIAYRVGNSPPPDCSSDIVISPGMISGTEYLVTGLTPVTNYSFIICALNCNVTPAFSNGTTASNMTTAFPVPPDPTNCSAMVVSDVEIDLSWLSGGGDTVGYQISYQVGPDPPFNCSTGTVIPYSVVIGTSFQVAGLFPNTTYTFRICAINGNPTPDFSAPGVNCSNTTTANACFNQTNGTLCFPLTASLQSCKMPDVCFEELCVPGGLFPNGTDCGLNGTQCQPQSFCDGFNPTCMQLAPFANGTFCGASATQCRSNDICALGNCTPGSIFNTTVQCGISPDQCIGPSFCSGFDGNCTQSAAFNTSVQCGFNQSECQPLSFCNGVNSTCPQTAGYNTSVSCGLNATECVNASFCNGLGACAQSPVFPGTTPCGLDPDICLAQSFCSGVNGTCIQQPFDSNTTQCGTSPNECIPPSFCFGFNQSCDQLPLFNTSVPCGVLPDECIDASFCDGFGSCNQVLLYNTSVKCGPNMTLCQPQAFCSGISQFCTIIPPLANGTICSFNASSDCGSVGLCESGQCVGGGFAPNGTACGPTPVECQSQMTCLLGNCTKNPPLSNGTNCGEGIGDSYCTIGGICDGTSDFCPNNTGFKPKGSNCSIFGCINGVCDGAGICNLNLSTSHCGTNESVITRLIETNFITTDDSFLYAIIPLAILAILGFLFIYLRRDKRFFKGVGF